LLLSDRCSTQSLLLAQAKLDQSDATKYADYVEACTNVRVAFHNRNGLSLVKLSEHEESAVAAHLHEQRMHSKRARKLWFVAVDETTSHWQFGWTVTTATSKVPPVGRQDPRLDGGHAHFRATNLRASSLRPVCHITPHLASCAPRFPSRGRRPARQSKLLIGLLFVTCMLTYIRTRIRVGQPS
jgi:hypothetical protein